MAPDLLRERGRVADDGVAAVPRDELDAAVSPHLLADFEGHVLRNRIARVALEIREDRLRRDPAGGRVPERERRDAVGVHVLRAFHEFGEAAQRASRGLVLGVLDLEQQRAVGLNDQRFVVGHVHPLFIKKNLPGRDLVVNPESRVPDMIKQTVYFIISSRTLPSTFAILRPRRRAIVGATSTLSITGSFAPGLIPAPQATSVA